MKVDNRNMEDARMTPEIVAMTYIELAVIFREVVMWRCVSYFQKARIKGLLNLKCHDWAVYLKVADSSDKKNYDMVYGCILL